MLTLRKSRVSSQKFSPWKRKKRKLNHPDPSKLEETSCFIIDLELSTISHDLRIMNQHQDDKFQPNFRRRIASNRHWGGGGGGRIHEEN